LNKELKKNLKKI